MEAGLHPVKYEGEHNNAGNLNEPDHAGNDKQKRNPMKGSFGGLFSCRSNRGDTTIPRNGSGVYSKPPGTTAVPNSTIESAKFNQVIDDIAQDLNFPRPATAGGTGGNSKQAGVDGLFDGTTVVSDSNLRISDPSDRTKIVRFDAGLVATGTTRVISVPDRDIVVSGVPRGHLFGLVLSNNASDSTNDIDVAAGECATDDAVPHLMVLSASLTKRLDATWAFGSGNGGWLDGAAMPNGTGHAFLIQRSDTGVVDVGFSASLSPVLPTNYDRKRRIGSIIRSGGAILGFRQNGDTFILNVAVMNRTSNAAQASTLLALTVPGGIVVQPIMVSTQQQNAVGNVQTRFANAGGNLATLVTTVANQEIGQAYIPSGIFTDTSGRIQYSVEFLGGTLLSNELLTKGWIDTRGQEV